MTPLARRTALLVASAALLLLALAFLFVRTHASGYKEQAQAVALLRELRDADTRWEADGLRLANDLGARPASAPDRGPVVTRVLQELERLGPNGLPAAELAQLRAGMASKQQAWVALKGAHTRSLEALGAAREALVATSAEAVALRARDPRSGERIAAFLAQAEQMRSVLRFTD